MPAPTHPDLLPGHVYRTRDLSVWGANAPRLAERLVREGVLVRLAHGLFSHPRYGRFGVLPPSDEELMRAFLDGGSFVFTGPERWNALGLGATAVFASSLVYNTKRSGTFNLGERTFVLRRVAFPAKPPPEWFVVDLFENADQAGATHADLAAALSRALGRRNFNRTRLRKMAMGYGTHITQALIEASIGASNRKEFRDKKRTLRTSRKRIRGKER